MHVGQHDLPPREIAKLGLDLLVGVSCNTEKQAMQLGQMESEGTLDASYFNIGPIYPTRTKVGLTEFIGPEAVARFSSHVSIPFTVMGGIKRDHVPELVSLGATRVAVVTALTKAADIAGETREWIQTIKRAGR